MNFLIINLTLHLGDMIIVLKNPGHEKVPKRPISLSEALRIYDKEICMGTKVIFLINEMFLIVYFFRRVKMSRKKSQCERLLSVPF